MNENKQENLTSTYLSQVTDREISKFCHIFFRYKINALRIKRSNGIARVQVWNEMNSLTPSGMCYFSDFQGSTLWIAFLYNKFGEKYLNQFINYKKDLIKKEYKNKLKLLKTTCKQDALKFNENYKKLLKTSLVKTKKSYFNDLIDLKNQVQDIKKYSDKFNEINAEK